MLQRCKWCWSVCKPALLLYGDLDWVTNQGKDIVFLLLDTLSLFFLSANHLNRLDFFLDSKLSLLPHPQKKTKKTEKPVLHRKFIKNISINDQCWKLATHVRHKASRTLRGLIPSSATFPHSRDNPHPTQQTCSSSLLPEDGTLVLN